MNQNQQAEIGVIGGSGFYTFLDDPVEVDVETPYGPPSDPVSIGVVSGADGREARRVAFLPRHGRDHRFAPHRVNYRANLWALRSLGVRQVLAPSAVGGLRPDLGPGTFVVPDQLIDMTSGRARTLYDAESPVVHVSFADPYCPRGRAAVVNAGDGLVDGGTLVVINGPRFSTRAESRMYAGFGGSVIGMTGMPEAAIARDLALCYTCVAAVTDLDAGVEAGEGVTHADVLAVFAANVDRLRTLMVTAILALPTDDECRCRHALDGLPLPFELP
jgi:5'-methylthioadenosine phosphorylase